MARPVLEEPPAPHRAKEWPDAIFAALEAAHVRQVAYVPDGGHAALIRRVGAAPSMRAVPLTTEEEGVALLAGAWLGGERGALLMQSSGVGNCINMLSLVRVCAFPFLALVAMRGEWGEINPWQVPMGGAAAAALGLMGIQTLRVERPDDAGPVVAAAASMAFAGGSAMAVLLGQRLIGAKSFVSDAGPSRLGEEAQP
jgi:sulfopyruvate decarboxylase alpha subunit